MTVLILLFVIIVLVVAHELGHFFAARILGVRVDEFGVGYPPRAKKLFVWKETVFTLNWLPFGGFVKIFGEQAITNPAPDSFIHQKLWKRLVILLAGIVANLILAVFLYTLAFSTSFLGSQDDFPKAKAVSDPRVVISNVMPESLAKENGIDSADIIMSLSSDTDVLTPISVSEVVDFISAHKGQILHISLKRHNDPYNVKIVLPENDGPALGVALVEVTQLRLPVGQSFIQAIKTTSHYFVLIGKAIIGMIGNVFGLGGKVVGEVSGPVGIAGVAMSAYTLGFGSFLMFMAIISINLAIINLIPFPALDGGRAVLELFTKRGKSLIGTRTVALINQIGFTILIVLMLFITYKDILRLV